MKKILLTIIKVIGIAFIILIVLNSAIRVTDGSENIGIIEDKLLGHSIWNFAKPKYSENYNRWKSASDASDKVADLLQKYGGSELTLNAELENQRKEAMKWSSKAFENASLIPKEYLRESNDELPDLYFDYFVNALNSWQKGFSNKDADLVNQGTDKYNEFITWMHLKSRDDFKSLH